MTSKGVSLGQRRVGFHSRCNGICFVGACELWPRAGGGQRALKRPPGEASRDEDDLTTTLCRWTHADDGGRLAALASEMQQRAIGHNEWINRAGAHCCRMGASVCLGICSCARPFISLLCGPPLQVATRRLFSGFRRHQARGRTASRFVVLAAETEEDPISQQLLVATATCSLLLLRPAAASR